MEKTRLGRQLSFQLRGVRPEKSDHGGSLKHPQKRKRPLATRATMHVVLRSSQAQGPYSFRKHQRLITETLAVFGKKHFVEILSVANVGNHLHLHLSLSHRKGYQAFIRAVTAALVIKITGFSRWAPAPQGFRFWDMRPFSRIVNTWRELLVLRKYIEINRWEGAGTMRSLARELVHRGLLAPRTG